MVLILFLLSFSSYFIDINIMSTQEKRLTKFPGSATNAVLDKRRVEPDSNSPSSASTFDLSKRIFVSQPQKRIRPPQIPLKANPQSGHYSFISRFNEPTDEICHQGNPWQEYYAILKEDQAGQVTVAYKNELNHSIMVIKELKVVHKDSCKQLKRCLHANIVSFEKAFLEGDQLYLVYG